MKLFYRIFAVCVLVLMGLIVVLPSLPVTAAGGDCLSYNPSALSVQQVRDYWIVTDGSSSMVALATQDDANKALAVAQQHTSHCFVGRDNNRSNRRDYIVEYWTGDSGLSPASFQEDCASPSIRLR